MVVGAGKKAYKYGNIMIILGHFMRLVLYKSLHLPMTHLVQTSYQPPADFVLVPLCSYSSYNYLRLHTGSYLLRFLLPTLGR